MLHFRLSLISCDQAALAVRESLRRKLCDCLVRIGQGGWQNADVVRRWETSLYIARYLKPNYVKLGFVGGHLDQIDPEKDPEKERQRLKGEVIEELTDLFMETGVVRNRHKFLNDMINREKRASTAVGSGIAVPHLRSMQPRELALVFARSRDGVEFDSPDGKPVHVFFGITAPEYDDKQSLQIYKWIAQSFLQEVWLMDALLEAEDEHEIIGILSGLH